MAPLVLFMESERAISRCRAEGIMLTVKKVLVATDFEDAAAAALTYGRALATAFGATLHVLHVTEDLMVISAGGAEAYIGVLPEVQEDTERLAREQAQALLTEDDRRLLHAEAITITSARIAHTILAYARDNACDLIVMGTHGRQALRRLMMGSVAERVARAASCPVLIVHAPEPEHVSADPAAAPTAAVPAHGARSR